MKNRSYVHLSLIFGLFLFACDHSSDDAASDATISRLELWVGHIQRVSDAQYYFNPKDSIPADYRFDLNSFGLNIFIAEYEKTNRKQAANQDQSNNYKVAPIQISSQYIPALISIYSDSTIQINGVSYEAGTSLTPYFEGFHNNGEWQPVLKMLEDFGTWYHYDPILLRMRSLPEKALNQKFIVKVTLENDDEFQLETPTIRTE